MTEWAALSEPGADKLAERVDGLAERVARWIEAVPVTVDAVEVWAELDDVWSWRLQDRVSVPDDHSTARFAVRVWRDGAVGHGSAETFEARAWEEALESALATRTDGAGPPPPAPSARCPGPVSFDPDLAEMVGSLRAWRQLSTALVDNTWHEAERIEGLTALGGNITYRSRGRVVGSRGGVLASLHGVLVTRLELNGVYGEVVRQVHAPESLLPTALAGARTWRTMPRGLISRSEAGSGGRVPVILHPRLLERLIREAGPAALSPERLAGAGREEGERIAALEFSLTDDATLDGRVSSRAFDDEGAATRRLPLVARGRLVQPLRGRVTAPDGAPAPATAVREGDSPHRNPPRPGFSTVVVDPGDTNFHELLSLVERALFVQAVDDLVVDEHGGFAGKVRWALALERGAEGRLVQPGEWTVSGSLFGRPDGAPGVLDDAILSREVLDTGTGSLPYCLALLTI